MKIDLRAILKSIARPPFCVKIITFVVTIISSIGSVLTLIFDAENELNLLSYILFSIAGISLFYSVYLIIPLFPKIKNSFICWMEKHDFTYLLLKNFAFRTLIFAILSFIMSLLFGAFNAYMGIANNSIWYGALAGFYICLAFLRGSVLVYHKNKIGKKVDKSADELKKLKIYKTSGIITLILNIALSCAIAQMIFSNAHFFYIGWTIFAYALYAFYKITTSIISFVKAHIQTDLTVRAIRNINLIDALVSVLALQTALLTSFSSGEFNSDLMNTITGIAVSIFSIAIGVYMIIFANKKIIKIQKES